VTRSRHVVVVRTDKQTRSVTPCKPVTGDTPADIPTWISPQRKSPWRNPLDRLGPGPHLVGRIGSGVRVNASFQIFSLRMLLTLRRVTSGYFLRVNGSTYEGYAPLRSPSYPSFDRKENDNYLQRYSLITATQHWPISSAHGCGVACL